MMFDMRKIFLFVLLALLTVGPGAVAAEVVAKVGGAEFTTDDVRAFLDTLPPADQEALAKDPAKLSQVVRLYLGQRLVLKEAMAAKFDQQAEVKARLERLRDSALAEFYLAAQVKLPDGYPSETELQAAYDANKSAFLAPRQYHLAQIFIKGAADDREAKAKLDAVVKKLKTKGADFAAIAREASDSNAQTAGDIGWVAESQLVPEIRSAAAGLAKDALSDPLRLDDGWHLIKLVDTRPAGTLPLAEVKPVLVERMRQAKTQQLRQAYVAQLLAKDPPVLNEMALAKITPAAK